MVDAVTRGKLNSKTPEQALELFESMAMNSYQWSTTRAKSNRIVGFYELDAVSGLATQIEALNRKIDGMSASHSVQLFLERFVEEVM